VDGRPRILSRKARDVQGALLAARRKLDCWKRSASVDLQEAFAAESTISLKQHDWRAMKCNLQRKAEFEDRYFNFYGAVRCRNRSFKSYRFKNKVEDKFLGSLVSEAQVMGEF
jgi:hypothetical protein